MISILGGNPVTVYPKSNFTPGTDTILSFPGDDVDELTAKACGSNGMRASMCSPAATTSFEGAGCVHPWRP